jgi:threonine synthase
MNASQLRCRDCARTYPLGSFFRCETCDGSLEVDYDYARVPARWLHRSAPAGCGALWKYLDLLPVEHSDNIVSLGEGASPLVSAGRSTDQLGLELELLFKQETMLPSASFKDRPITVAISKACELSVDTIVVASTGNTAASAAMYAARAGIPCVVCVPESTELAKVQQAVDHAARVVRIQGNYSDAYRLAKEAGDRYGWYNVATTFINPYTVEGDKTVAYEIFEQMGQRVPDWVFVPIGAGPLLVGIHKGFLELKRLGMASGVPRLVGVQAEGCAPIVDAFVEGLPRVRAWGKGTATVASAIADPLTGYEHDGDVTLGSIRGSGGAAVAVSDPDIEQARLHLAQKEGIYAEPASAAVFGALRTMCRKGLLSARQSVVCVITGHGLKYKASGGVVPPLVSRVEELREALG